jgi:hypothetical protein
VSRPLVVLLSCLLVARAHAAEPALHDPTQPYNAAAVDAAGPTVGAPTPRFRLTGVLISPTRRIAILNGKPCQEGQRVAGAQLMKIESRSVQLRDGNHEIVVLLGKARAVAPPAEGDSGQ